MKLRIRSHSQCDREELRALLIDAADELVGTDNCLLEAQLPWDGHPILLTDANRHPVLVSFDLLNSQAALLSGLHGTDQLAAALPWINRVYRQLEQRHKPPRLVVVTGEPPPGSQAVLRASGPALSLFSCKVLSVNGDTGILLEPLNEARLNLQLNGAPTAVKAVATPAPVMTPAPESAADTLPPLTEDERSYFQQL